MLNPGTPVVLLKTITWLTHSVAAGSLGRVERSLQGNTAYPHYVDFGGHEIWVEHREIRVMSPLELLALEADDDA